MKLEMIKEIKFQNGKGYGKKGCLLLMRTDLISIVGGSNRKESNLEQLELLKVIENQRPNIYFNL